MIDPTDSAEGTVFQFDGAGISLNYLRRYGFERSYVHGFKKAADVLFEQLITNIDAHQELFLPMCFLYRHYLELQCKYLRRCCSTMQGTAERPKEIHKLRPLWDDLRPVLQKQFPDFTQAPFDRVQQVIYEFATVDETGQEFRYSLRTDKDESLKTLPAITAIQPLKDEIDAAHSFLEQFAFEMEIEFPRNIPDSR